MRRVTANGLLLAGLLFITSGCRHGWVRPGATEQDFLTDYNCCRYGCDEEQQSAAAAGKEQQGDARKRIKRNYKLCLRLRGWKVVRGKGFRP